MHVALEVGVLLLKAAEVTDPNAHGFLYDVQSFSKFLLTNGPQILQGTLAVATLLSAGGLLSGRFGWLRMLIAPRRKNELVEQIGKLAESMSKVHELPEWAGEMNAEIRAALKAEMDNKLTELKKLQSPVQLTGQWTWQSTGQSTGQATGRATRQATGGSWAAVKNWFKYTFVWWLPKGFGAWCFHLSYYLLLTLIGVMSLGFLIGVLSAQKGWHPDGTDIGMATALYVVLGVPALVLRFFAARIYKHQCEDRLRECKTVPA